MKANVHYLKKSVLCFIVFLILACNSSENQNIALVNIDSEISKEVKIEAEYFTDSSGSVIIEKINDEVIRDIGHFIELIKIKREDVFIETKSLKGFEKSVASTNIIKLENDSVLIYIKPPVGFFGADHSPKICWSGSGYKLKNQKETRLEQYLIQTSELIDKEDNILYTAWWFDNGSDKTGLQLEWRTKSLNGAAPFRLINVTTANPQQTLKTAKTLLSKNLFR